MTLIYKFQINISCTSFSVEELAGHKLSTTTLSELTKDLNSLLYVPV